MHVQKVLFCPFHWKPRPSGVSLESPELENILQVPGNGAEVDENYDARNGLSAILRDWSLKVSLQKVLLCPFHCKPRPSGLSFESPGLENIPKVPGNRAEVAQIHVARRAVSATLSVLKRSVAMFLQRSSKVSLEKVFLCPFHCKPRLSGVILDSAGVENILKFAGNWSRSWSNSWCA